MNKNSSSSVLMLTGNGESIEIVRKNMDIILFQLTNHLESLQTHSASIFQHIYEKLSVVYGHSVEWVEKTEFHRRLFLILEAFGAKSREIFTSIRSQGFHIRISSFSNEFKKFINGEVTKQAIIFGCCGLLTGLVIGYSVKCSSISSQFYYQNSGSNTFMKAILSSSTRRGIDGITLSSIQRPSILRPDEILVQVKAMAIDNIDAKVAEGFIHYLRACIGYSKLKEPFILGRECTGVVEEVGQKVLSFEVNDRVWVCLPIWTSTGVMSEYITVSEKYAGHKPRNISYEGAATMPYAALIVWKKILKESELGPHNSKNKRILIHLGFLTKNDGVGLLATQVFRTWGARVTISTLENTDIDYLSGSGVAQMTFLHTLKSLGAESHLILPNDHTLLPNLTQRIFDVVINTDIPELTDLLSSFCKDPECRVIETFPQSLVENSNSFFGILFQYLRYPFTLLFGQREKEEESTQSILEECKRLVESGLIVPVVAKTFFASQYDMAFNHVAHSSNNIAYAHVGKNVLTFK